ncbi:hypothetical protein FWK35_00020315, partial [Aphis craccivora]
MEVAADQEKLELSNVEIMQE